MEHGFRTDRTRYRHRPHDRRAGRLREHLVQRHGPRYGRRRARHLFDRRRYVTPDHTLSFNCIGYDTCTVRLRDIPQDGTFDAFLAPVPQVIEEVTVVPVKTRLKRLGNNFRSPLMEAVHQDDLTGVEFGTIIKIKKDLAGRSPDKTS